MKIRMMSLLAGVLVAGISQAALVGEWKFEDGLATDTSGNGNDGTIVGSLSSVSGVEAGTDAFEFGSTANYVSIPVGVFNTVSDEVSIAMWTFGDAVILGDGATANSAFGANTRNTLHSHTPWHNGALYWDAGGKRQNYSPSPASKYKGKWNHMVFTMNAVTGDKKVYINGVQDSPDWNDTLAAISGITHFYIGRAGDSAKAYYGKLDEFQIYNHELSATEIANLYAAVEVDAYATAIIASSETSGVTPLEIVFNGTNSTASGSITSYDWDFGDGTGATGPLATNTYTVSGVYTASLEIATSEGLYSTSTVEIVAQSYVGVELDVTVEYREDDDGNLMTNAPSFYTDDLGQTAFLSTEGEGDGSDSVGNLFNGILTSEARWSSTSVKTINFDISGAPLGYDITEISTIAGWNVGANGRSNQEFGMSVTYVDGSSAILTDAQNWAPNNPASYWTKVTFVEDNGLPMARGVKAITWYDFADANANGVVIAREFDVLGVSTSDDALYAGFSATPKTGAPPLEVAFDGSMSISGTNIVSYAWDFGDGNFDSGMMVTNTYTTSGDYTAQLTVTDANGSVDSHTVEIEVLNFVSAVAEATPVSGEAPLEVAFAGTNSTSSGSIVSYAWDFGDGNVDSGAMVTNTYVVAGDYAATMIVTDGNGLMDTNTVDISVGKVLNVNYVQYSEMIYSNKVPVISTDDLAETAYLSSEGTGGNESAQHAQLFNGLIGNQDGDTNDEGEVRLTSGEAITVTFDTSVNELGYDIDMIETFAGWTPTTYSETATNNLSRSNQGYEIIVGFVDGTFGTMAGPEHWEPNGEDSWTNSVGFEVNDTYWTKVGFTNATGAAMLTNVKSLTFDIANNAQAGGVVIYREFDVFGVPSTGYYPSSIVIGSNDGGESLSWETDGVYTYGIQSNLNLVYGDWGTFTNVTGTPPLTTVVLPPKNQGAEFYRVIVE